MTYDKDPLQKNSNLEATGAYFTAAVGFDGEIRIVPSVSGFIAVWWVQNERLKWSEIGRRECVIIGPTEGLQTFIQSDCVL